MGTIVAARQSLECGLAVNLGGGFHHAKPDGGEGFCIYSDIALAIHALRSEELLSAEARVVYIDLDAHQGNGVCHAFMHDARVFIFDMYNSTIYPSYDLEAQERIDCGVRLTSNCSEGEYLRELHGRLPGFLDSATRSPGVGLAIYNAGTDVLADDPLGQLCLSAEGVLKRDLFVIEQLRRRGIPTLMLPSGGYTEASHRLIAETVVELLQSEGGRRDNPE
jgi:histone deacetylase 11